jgi:hypothetical protein
MRNNDGKLLEQLTALELQPTQPATSVDNHFTRQYNPEDSSEQVGVV